MSPDQAADTRPTGTGPKRVDMQTGCNPRCGEPARHSLGRPAAGTAGSPAGRSADTAVRTVADRRPRRPLRLRPDVAMPTAVPAVKPSAVLRSPGHPVADMHQAAGRHRAAESGWQAVSVDRPRLQVQRHIQPGSAPAERRRLGDTRWPGREAAGRQARLAAEGERGVVPPVPRAGATSRAREPPRTLAGAPARRAQRAQRGREARAGAGGASYAGGGATCASDTDGCATGGGGGAGAWYTGASAGAAHVDAAGCSAAAAQDCATGSSAGGAHVDAAGCSAGAAHEDAAGGSAAAAQGSRASTTASLSSAASDVDQRDSGDVSAPTSEWTSPASVAACSGTTSQGCDRSSPGAAAAGESRSSNVSGCHGSPGRCGSLIRVPPWYRLGANVRSVPTLRLVASVAG